MEQTVVVYMHWEWQKHAVYSPTESLSGHIELGARGKRGMFIHNTGYGFYFGFVSLSNDIVGILSNQDLPSFFGKESILRLSHQNR